MAQLLHPPHLTAHAPLDPTIAPAPPQAAPTPHLMQLGSITGACKKSGTHGRRQKPVSPQTSAPRARPRSPSRRHRRLHSPPRCPLWRFEYKRRASSVRDCVTGEKLHEVHVTTPPLTTQPCFIGKGRPKGRVSDHGRDPLARGGGMPHGRARLEYTTASHPQGHRKPRGRSNRGGTTLRLAFCVACDALPRRSNRLHPVCKLLSGDMLSDATGAHSVSGR